LTRNAFPLGLPSTRRAGTSDRGTQMLPSPQGLAQRRDLGDGPL